MPNIINLGPLAAAITRMRDAAYASDKKYIVNVDPSHWPSALQPVAPIGPPGSLPLMRPIQMGQNLVLTPRWDAKYSANELKTFASYILARICIENVKDTICSLDWKIESKKKQGET